MLINTRKGNIMIFLTRNDEDKTKFSLNHRRIINVEESISRLSNVYLDNGKVLTVVETKEEIIDKTRNYEVSVIKEAIQEAIQATKQVN